MTAKHKLNSAHLNGTIIIAATVGYVTRSIPVFLIALCVLVAQGLHNGSLRK